MSSGIVNVYDVCPVKPVLSAVYANNNCFSNDVGDISTVYDDAGETTAVVIFAGSTNVAIDVLS